MASSGRSATPFFQVLFALALALLLATCIAESDFHSFGLGEMKVPGQPPLNCDSVHAVLAGETCFAIAQQFHLTTEQFVTINPNLVCDKLFIGQWLCVAGEQAS